MYAIGTSQNAKDVYMSILDSEPPNIKTDGAASILSYESLKMNQPRKSIG